MPTRDDITAAMRVFITSGSVNGDPAMQRYLLRNLTTFAAAPDLFRTLAIIADFPCNCEPDNLPGDDCESCIARAALARFKEPT